MRKVRVAAAAILLTALVAAGPGSARTRVACAPKQPCPDLTLKLTGFHFTPDRLNLVLSVEVVNTGVVDAPATTVAASADGSPTATTDVRALSGSGDSQDVDATLPIPDSARGHPSSITLVADPADQIDESDETNNSIETDPIVIPAGDLRVDLTGTEFAQAGRTLVLHTLVRNAGKGITAPTVVEAGGTGWTATGDVPTLAPGQRAPVDVSVTIPDNVRGATATVIATVDPAHDVSETSYDDNMSSSLNVAIAAGDLTTSIASARLGASQLALGVTVTNGGVAPTAATIVSADAPGWQGVSAAVRSLNAGASTTVTLRLAVPASAVGTTASFAATVDPAHDIPETTYTNNGSSPFHVKIPAAPPKPPGLANLTVRVLRASVSGDPRLATLLEIANSGGRPSQATDVLLSVAFGRTLSRTQPVPILSAHSSRLVRVTLPVPEAARGRRLRVAATVDPRHDVPEANYADNVSSPFSLVARRLPRLPPPPTSSPKSNWPAWVAVACGLLLAALVLGYFWSRFRRRVRLRWQNEAHDEEHPETCEAPETYVWRHECKPRPALRHVEKIMLLRDMDGEEVEHEANEKLAAGLNRAVRAHRTLRGRTRLHELLEPAAAMLAREAESWAGGDGATRVRAGLKGGKVECEFKRYECVRRGPACNWEERQSWSAELEDETEEPVAILELPLLESSLAALAADLFAFVKRVDVPSVDRPQERAPNPQ